MDGLVGEEGHEQLEGGRLQVGADGEDAATVVVVGHAGGQIGVAGGFLEADEGGRFAGAVVAPQERAHAGIGEGAGEGRERGPHLRRGDGLVIHDVVQGQGGVTDGGRGAALVEVGLEGGAHKRRVAVGGGRGLGCAGLHEGEIAEGEDATRPAARRAR